MWHNVTMIFRGYHLKSKVWPLVMASVLWSGCASLRTLDAPEPVGIDATTDFDEALEHVHRLTQAIMHIRRSYVDESKTDYESLMQGALRGLLQSLDPYSQFLDTEAFRGLREDAAGEFGGIGITIGMRDNILTVIAPMEDTPAFRAGILAGDKIVEIDERKTDGMTLSETVRLLRGEIGSAVTLRVLREDVRELQTFELERDVIRVSSVRGEQLMEGGIGYVRLTQFSETTAASLQNALNRLLADGMQALILDLRNNSGGLLISAIEVSQKFLPNGALIVTTRGRGDRVIGAPAKASGPHHYPHLPMAILVNGGSASAAEIVAASLQDNRRAILVGEKTFGKGSVQSVLPLEQESAIRLTTARYYTPSERVIHEQGIEPDIEVVMSPEMWRKVQMQRLRAESPEIARDLEPNGGNDHDAVDIQLERATDLLKALLIFQDKR